MDFLDVECDQRNIIRTMQRAWAMGNSRAKNPCKTKTAQWRAVSLRGLKLLVFQAGGHFYEDVGDTLAPIAAKRNNAKTLESQLRSTCLQSVT
jgi:hypothetical protein